MNTLNVVSTPEITGNIGSCTSQVVSAVSGRPSLWIREMTHVVTNSCTGEVTTYGSWEFCFSTLIASIMIFVVSISILSLIKYSMTPKSRRDFPFN